LARKIINKKLSEQKDMTLERKKMGAAGEAAAARFLRRNGYKIVARNWRCAAGEIDIVARRRALLVFVEVKTRVTDEYADPMQNVNFSKKKHIIATAKAFLRDKKLTGEEYRFDVVSVVWGSGRRPEKIEHHEGAFSEGRR
jgi:putative endonuclease